MIGPNPLFSLKKGNKMTFQFSDILKHLPHREPFLFVDKIISVELGDKIHAQKNLLIDDEIFNGHFPNMPIMPGVLIIEALAQAAGILGFMTMSKTPDEGSIYYFAGADKVRFKNSVGPGDTIDLYASICSEKRGIWKFNCKAEAKGKNVCEAIILCADRPK